MYQQLNNRTLFEAYYCISCAFALQRTEAVAVFARKDPAMSVSTITESPALCMS